MNLDDVFKSIYSAIVEAQNTVEQHYLGEIKEDYFDSKGNPYTIPISLPVGNSGEMQTVNVPTITLVPHNGMAIKEVSIEMQVALSDSDEKHTDKGKGGILKKFVTDLSKRNSSKRMAQIKVVFNGKEPPEGLARIKDNMNKLIP